ncbi:MAG: helix-turn-helix domain-containing protein [Pseudanabaenaceae cyanobacterium bins.39]|nr:helix-turn-helix domain-containing protein [Pseudanabaenaceae cyanobacterium bins.39]
MDKLVVTFPDTFTEPIQLEETTYECSYQSDRNSCPVEATLKAIGGRWKVLILHQLFNGTKRFGELHRSLHGITQKMLTQQLREMEHDGLIHREIYMQVPPKVEYSLTPLGKTLRPVLDVMHLWGKKYLENQNP